MLLLHALILTILHAQVGGDCTLGQKLCKGKPYSFIEKCCDGELVSTSLSCDRCQGRRYKYRSERCCNNKILSSSYRSCELCGGKFMAGVSVCCNDKITPGFTCEMGKCMGGKSYNTYTEKCCGTEPTPLNIGCTACNGTKYETRRYRCCNGALVNYYLTCNKCGDKYMRRWETCNNGVIERAKSYGSCGGVQLRYGQKCCDGKSYSSYSEVCCNGNLIGINEPCDLCNGEPYVKRTHTCCNGKIFYGKECTESVCPDGKTRFDTVKYKCCDQNRVVKRSDSCKSCGGYIYSGSSYKCCNNNRVTYWSYSCTLCRGRLFQDSHEECCQGIIVPKGTCSSKWW